MNIQEYEQALLKHDWYYEYSDDFSVWKKGNEISLALKKYAITNVLFKELYDKIKPSNVRV